MWKWIKEHALEIYMGVLLVAGALYGGGLALANVIPLGERERDYQKMIAGVQIIALCLFLAGFLLLVKFALDKFFAWGEKKYGNWETYTASVNFPKTEERTVQKILTTLTGKALLLVWDILQGCGYFAMFIAVLSCWEDSEIDKPAIFLVLLQGIVYAVGIHFLILLYYKKKDYTGKLFKYTEKYLGAVNRERFIAQLEMDLKNHMLVYSKMWILTQNYIMGWSETEMSFHPVAIPRDEIVKIGFRVSDKWFGHGKRSICPVIICSLQNGKTVEIFAGSRFQVQAVQQLVSRFLSDNL